MTSVAVSVSRSPRSASREASRRVSPAMPARWRRRDSSRTSRISVSTAAALKSAATMSPQRSLMFRLMVAAIRSSSIGSVLVGMAEARARTSPSSSIRSLRARMIARLEPRRS